MSGRGRWCSKPWGSPPPLLFRMCMKLSGLSFFCFASVCKQSGCMLISLYVCKNTGVSEYVFAAWLGGSDGTAGAWCLKVLRGNVKERRPDGLGRGAKGKSPVRGTELLHFQSRGREKAWARGIGCLGSTKVMGYACWLWASTCVVVWRRSRSRRRGSPANRIRQMATMMTTVSLPVCIMPEEIRRVVDRAAG